MLLHLFRLFEGKDGDFDLFFLDKGKVVFRASYEKIKWIFTDLSELLVNHRYNWDFSEFNAYSDHDIYYRFCLKNSTVIAEKTTKTIELSPRFYELAEQVNFDLTQIEKKREEYLNLVKLLQEQMEEYYSKYPEVK